MLIPELYSHCIKPEITVQQVYDENLETFMVARHSAVAGDQLLQVNEIMGDHTKGRK